MNNSMISRQKAVGYVRVSTNLQVERDDSLERQAARIRQAASDEGWDLIGLYEDLASAIGKDSLVSRPGLRDALKMGAREGAFIIVTEPTRLFRNRQFGLKLLRYSGVKVYSLKDKGFLSRERLGNAFRAGAEQAEKLRDVTSKAKAKSARSIAPGTKAVENSKISRKRTSTEIAEQIATILQEDSSLQSLSHRDFAEMLNLRGLRSGWGRLWNHQTVRNQRAAANRLLKEWLELENEVDPFVPSEQGSTSRSSFQPSFREKKTQPEALPKLRVGQDTPIAVERNSDQTAEIGYEDNPLFGLF